MNSYNIFNQPSPFPNAQNPFQQQNSSPFARSITSYPMQNDNYSLRPKYDVTKISYLSVIGGNDSHSTCICSMDKYKHLNTIQLRVDDYNSIRSNNIDQNTKYLVMNQISNRQFNQKLLDNQIQGNFMIQNQIPNPMLNTQQTRMQTDNRNTMQTRSNPFAQNNIQSNPFNVSSTQNVFANTQSQPQQQNIFNNSTTNNPFANNNNINTSTSRNIFAQTQNQNIFSQANSNNLFNNHQSSNLFNNFSSNPFASNQNLFSPFNQINQYPQVHTFQITTEQIGQITQNLLSQLSNKETNDNQLSTQEIPEFDKKLSPPRFDVDNFKRKNKQNNFEIPKQKDTQINQVKSKNSFVKSPLNFCKEEMQKSVNTDLLKSSKILPKLELNNSFRKIEITQQQTNQDSKLQLNFQFSIQNILLDYNYTRKISSSQTPKGLRAFLIFPLVEAGLITEIDYRQYIKTSEFTYNCMRMIEDKPFQSFGLPQNSIVTICLLKSLHPFISSTEITTSPSIQVLQTLTKEQLQRVTDFTIYHHFATIYWPGETDLTYIDIDETVKISEGYVELYDENIYGQNKPPIGSKLNKLCFVTFKNTKLFEPDCDINVIYHYLTKECDKNGVILKNLNPEQKSWVIQIEHFSSYDFHVSKRNKQEN